ncbi:hypothetical protein N0V87_009534 [Didymella glomerata]|uniref:YTH domain-containing protein n=1 Tax=Didymella glomerata TaxID=749621 RepID=A0A9W8WQZ0_9PLEO|nr:hypothetical protein N0V87_009534 [Didymella glomerata]
MKGRRLDTQAGPIFHKSRFNGAVLVCRLRRSSVPTCKHLTASDVTLSVEQPQDRLPATSDQDKPTAGAVTVRQVRANDNIDERRINVLARYFILKSLTILDLQLSVRHGVWVTQRHNEDALNQAFQSTNNVYLFFSANKSGEFFGYARMASRLLEGGVEPSCMGVKVVPNDMQDALDAPKVTMTPATRWAPRGRVVDDSARGTVFWEAGPSTSESAAEAPKAAEPSSTERGASLVAHGQGRPFRIQWISTTRLPFYRTRGLRNPWNANREVKRARDGTELEADVGERLLQLFLHS